MAAVGGSPIRTALFVVGIALVVAAIAWPILSKYVGRLPGDVVVRRPGFTFVFPIVTCLVLSWLSAAAVAARPAAERFQGAPEPRFSTSR